MPRRTLIVAAVVAVLGLCAVALRTAGGASAQEETETVTARLGTLVVTVGGVGKIVEATPTIQVLPRTTGVASEVLAQRGERVQAGDVLVVLDDGGAAAAVTDQAEADLATAQLDLRQKRAARPVEVRAARTDVQRAEADLVLLQGGSLEARQRAIRLAEQNIQAAEQRLDRLFAPPTEAEVRAAQAELRRAEAALATLRAPQPAPLPEVIAAAQQAVVVARQNLARAQAFGTPAEISAAQLELYRAQAELANLLRQPAGPLPEEIAAAEAAVESARANLRRLYAPPAPADVAAARLELERARADLRQLRTGPSVEQLESALGAISSAQARLGQSRSSFAVDMARQGVAGARARLASAQAAERALTIRAPVDGTVTAIVAEGSFVDLSTSIATVASLDELAVTVDLSEFDVAQVELGQKATVSVDALGGEDYPGYVSYVAPSGVDTNGLITFPVQVALREAEDVKPGMSVSARIFVARVAKAVILPLEAVQFDDEDNAFVTVLTEAGTEKRRPVEVGLSNNKSIQILEGLEAGEEVLIVAPPEEEE